MCICYRVRQHCQTRSAAVDIPIFTIPAPRTPLISMDTRNRFVNRTRGNLRIVFICRLFARPSLLLFFLNPEKSLYPARFTNRLRLSYIVRGKFRGEEADPISPRALTNTIHIGPVVKVIGNTTYIAESFFDSDANCTLTDKIKTLIDRDVELRTKTLLPGRSELTSQHPD